MKHGDKSVRSILYAKKNKIKKEVEARGGWTKELAKKYNKLDRAVKRLERRR